MKDPIEVLKQKIDERGITIAKLADRCDVKRARFYQALAAQPHRRLTLREFLTICITLGIEIKDFYDDGEAEQNEDTTATNKTT